MAKSYKHQPAFQSGRLPVGDIHVLHYEQYGKPAGKPALFVHGGPGGHTSIDNTSWFDPEVYRVVLFDQRGAGKSTPSAEIRENTSQHLIADIEALRRLLNIEKWHLVFGGSWGSTLSLMYAQEHPSRVGSLILRGVHTGREKELDFSRGPNGAAMIFPAAYSDFLKPLPLEDRHDPVKGYYKLLQTADPDVRRIATREFNAWDLWRNQIQAPAAEFWDMLDDHKWCFEHAMIMTHYFSHGEFIEEGQLLRKENIDKIRQIPCTIIQGQYDICTVPQTAWDLHQQWPESELHMIPMAGHTSMEPGIFEQLVKACDKYTHL